MNAVDTNVYVYTIDADDVLAQGSSGIAEPGFV